MAKKGNGILSQMEKANVNNDHTILTEDCKKNT